MSYSEKLWRFVEQDRDNSVVLTGITFAILAFTVRWSGLEGFGETVIAVLSFASSFFFAVAFCLYSRYPGTGNVKSLEWGRYMFTLGKFFLIMIFPFFAYYYLLGKLETYPFITLIIATFGAAVFLVLRWFYGEKYKPYLREEYTQKSQP